MEEVQGCDDEAERLEMEVSAVYHCDKVGTVVLCRCPGSQVVPSEFSDPLVNRAPFVMFFCCY